MTKKSWWTNKPPTEPGLYWYALIDSTYVRRHCEVFMHRRKACINTVAGPMPASGPHRVWCGPLPPPSGKATWSSQSVHQCPPGRVADGSEHAQAKGADDYADHQ